MMKIDSLFGRLIAAASLAALTVFAVFAFVNSPAVAAEDYGAAMKRAKAEDKAIVLYFYSRYCPYCTAMERDVLADKEIAKTLKTNLVSVRVDVELRSDLAAKYGIRGYPTTCLLEPSGKPLIKIPGYVGRKDFTVILDYAKGKHYKTIGLREYMKKQGIDVG